MGGSDGLSRLPACLAAARGLCVMGLAGGILGARNALVLAAQSLLLCPPLCRASCCSTGAKPQRPREGWPVACGLSPELYGRREDRGPTVAGAGLALPLLHVLHASPPPASLSSLVCLPACLLLLLSCCSPLCPSLHRSRASARLISRPACAPLCLHSQSAFTALKLATSGQRRAASLVTDCLAPVPSNHSLVTPP
jgi:hypothetical protein